MAHRVAPRRLPAAFVALLVVAVTLAGWSSGLFVAAQDVTPSATPPPPVEVPLADVSGAEVGTATFTEGADGGVTVAVQVSGLPPGELGIHVHEMGMCDPAGEQPFSTAGAHYNPTGGMHGGPPTAEEAATPGGNQMIHAGDLGNITIAEDGTGTLEIPTSRFTLSPGPTSLFDMDGSAIIIHDMADDLMSQPSGNSGGRIVCGVVAPPSETMMATPDAGGTPMPDAVTEGYVLNPEQVPFSEDLLGQLQVPEGFEVSVYAQGLSGPRMMAAGPDGTVYVTHPAASNVSALRDTDGDGVIDETMTVASNLQSVHGITIQENRVYLAGERQAWVADILPDGMLGETTVLVDNLPYGGQHGRRTITFGPDGMLYIHIGSTCNSCPETDEEHATILRFNPDGSGREIFASGLRNMLAYDWHPDTGEMWGMDMGSDFRGNDQPPDELNRITQGSDYGWPYCYADQQVDEHQPYVPTGATRAQYCENTEPSVLAYQAHSSPVDLVFYDGTQFPEEFQGDAFVTMRGSWNRLPAVGYEIVRVQFDESGQPASIDPFISGWLTDGGASHFGRIAGLLLLPDGSMLVSEDTNGVIYRITYTGG